MRFRIVLLASWLSLGAACASGPLGVPEDLYPHVLSIDTDGASNELVLEGESETFSDIEQHVADIVAELAASEKNHVVLVIHGGLVGKRDAMREAKKQLAAMGDDVSFYPIFVNWETGMLASYGDHLFSVRNGFRSTLAPFTSPLYLIADLGRALARLPITLLKQGAQNLRDYQQHPPSAPPRGWGKTMWIDRRNEQRGAWETAGVHALGIVPGVARLVTTPLLDGIGRSAFLNMRRRARVLFLLDDAFGHPERIEAGALSLLMDELRRIYYESCKVSSISDEAGETYDELEIRHLMRVDDVRTAWLGRDDALADRLIESLRSERDAMIRRPDAPLRITILAHSMGAIVANELIQRNSDLFYDDIVYMGAACTVREFTDSALAYVKQSPMTHFYNLCLHPAEESDDRYGSQLLPHGSLLDWIDAYITEIESPLDLTLGKWENVAATFHLMDYLPSDVRARMLVRGFARDADQSNPAQPQDHCQFDDVEFEFWKPEFWDFRLDPRTSEAWK